MAKFLMTPVVGDSKYYTARLGAGTGASNNLNDTDERGKFVKLIAESRYGLAALGDQIEGVIDSINTATSDGYSVGAVRSGGLMQVTFDGAQVGGAGALAVGDYVLVGNVSAKGTALTAPAKVCKATDQAAAKATPFAARVVSLGTVGSGAVGTVGVIQFV